ncbi:hypothetical protein DUNSADRAFT_3196 [Dunaliella salina]|uniref:Arrestin C-terminal-like domain-containing protein n=1 Tax=Dunaliella salina TaxID=3046 RepID=A0ABQ7FVK9_DUNSA|nr:hypothetical protein DUNSADRAFT_3196 [Dunaliella salina]|eukprot:KAF5826424.1 hypothetical protein DUNSADRAFT_3196 [Dunaliella salina]
MNKQTFSTPYLFFSGRTQLVGHEAALGGKGTIGPGTYQFPFQFVLPPTLPGSVDWDQKTCNESPSKMYGGRAWIRYHVQAICVRPGMFVRNIRSDQLPFKLLPVWSVPHTGPAEFKDSQESRICCCIPQGSISGSLVLPTNVAYVGSEVVIKVQLENQTSAPIRRVRVHLLQRVRLRNDAGYSRSGFLTFVSVVDTNLDHTALQPGSAPSVECRVPVPQHIPPTTSGRHIQIEYTVELLAKMNSARQSFRLNAPILINGAPPASAMMLPPMPPAPPPSITIAVPGSESSTSPYPNISSDPLQHHGGSVLPNKTVDATAPSPAPYPPLGIAPPHPPANGGGEAPPCYSYPPMQAPPNWYPAIQKTAFLDLNAPPTDKKLADGDDDDDDEMK